MMYPEPIIAPMREELTRLGVEELRTADAVHGALKDATGTQPAVGMSLQGAGRPDKLYTVFAGQDADATATARGYFTGYPPSSPAIALLKDGDVAFMLERWQIEGRSAQEIAQDLAQAYEQHCAGAQAA